MERWKNFLDSFATAGGNLFILCFFVFTLLFVMTKIHYSDQIDTVIISIFSGFSGALLQALTGKNHA